MEARFDAAGTITPRSFTWRGSTLTVEGVGRRWREGSRRCFAVMAAGKPFHLCMDEATFRWWVSCRAASGWMV